MLLVFFDFCTKIGLNFANLQIHGRYIEDIACISAPGYVFCDFAKTEGIIVLFSVLACCVLPFVEKDFHARRRAAAAEAANRSGQLVQMA